MLKYNKNVNMARGVLRVSQLALAIDIVNLSTKVNKRILSEILSALLVLSS